MPLSAAGSVLEWGRYVCEVEPEEKYRQYGEKQEEYASFPLFHGAALLSSRLLLCHYTGISAAAQGGFTGGAGVLSRLGRMNRLTDGAAVCIMGVYF